jgi:hypothetical protein
MKFSSGIRFSVSSAGCTAPAQQRGDDADPPIRVTGGLIRQGVARTAPLYAGFQKLMIRPPHITKAPPQTIGKFGSERKATKLITCQTMNKVAI